MPGGGSSPRKPIGPPAVEESGSKRRKPASAQRDPIEQLVSAAVWRVDYGTAQRTV